jgi:hypothetical protein
MKKIILLLLPFLSFSCIKDDNAAKVENITKGSKWNIRIGSSYSEVYSQLQQLGNEKQFYEVAVVRQQPLTKVEDLQNRFMYYSSLYLETTGAKTEQVYLGLGKDNITALQIGGLAPGETIKWPLNAADDIAIHKNDPLNTLYNKLLVIYQMPQYKDNYRIILSNKPLNKQFDPNMVNYEEWAFDFSANIDGTQRTGRSSVRLLFKNGKLNKIVHTYDEAEVYI